MNVLFQNDHLFSCKINESSAANLIIFHIVKDVTDIV
jgi:hypothetical protein